MEPKIRRAQIIKLSSTDCNSINDYKIKLILFVIGTTSVLPTLWGTFVFDDTEAILKNNDVINTTLIDSAVFFNDFWGTSITQINSHKSYRPLTTLTYKFDFLLWNRNSLPFHLVNIILHGINCALHHNFLLNSISTLSNYNKLSDNTHEIAFWTSLLFASHPIHVEPLGSVVGRADLISTLFIIVGLIALPSNKKSHGLFIYLKIVALGIIGSLFKENAISLVVLYVCLRAYRSIRLRKFEEILYMIVSILLCGSFIGWRLWFQGGSPIFQHFDNPPAFAKNYFTKISSIFYVWTLNLFVLICPVWLCYDWSMGCVPLINSISDFRFIIVAFVLIFGLRVLFFTLHFNSKILATALIISFATFLPSSNLIFTVGFVLAERNLYLTTSGLTLCSTYFIYQFPRARRKVLVFILLMFYMRSVKRSLEWIDHKNLFLSALNVCPNNAKVHYNIATMYGDMGNTDRAIKSYKRSIDLKFDYYQAMNNLGNILRSSDKLEEAEYWLRKALDHKPDFAAAWMNLGIVLSKNKPYEAMECYKSALNYRRHYPDCEYNLGNLYLDSGDKEKARKSWERVIKIQPTHTQAWLNLVILLDQENELIEAKKTGLRARESLGSSDHTLEFLLGNINGRLEEFELAKIHFEKAIQICEESDKHVPAKYWSNLGVLYHRWKKKSKAINCYRKALEIDPSSRLTKSNLEGLLTSQ